MNEHDRQQYTVSLQIYGIPESNGLRIRSTNPVGLYVASLDAEAAKFYFQSCILDVLIREELIEAGPGIPIMSNEVPWDAFVNAGHGTIEFRTLSKDVPASFTANMVRHLPPKKLTVDRWDAADGKSYYVVRDPDDSKIDEWFLAAIKEDVARAAAMQ